MPRSPFKPRWWQRLLSYFWLVRLPTPPSTVTPSLEVRLSDGRLVVDATGVNYAFGGLDHFFRAAFRRLGIPEAQMQKVLILGFGSGNVATILREWETGPPLDITGVEQDGSMLEIGRRYFHLDELEPLELKIQDAAAYVRQAPQKQFDLIVVDLFVEDVVPQRFTTTAFLKKLGALLRPRGLLFFNRLMDTEQHRRESEAFLTHMQAALPGTTGRRVQRNLVCLYRAAGS